MLTPIHPTLTPCVKAQRPAPAADLTSQLSDLAPASELAAQLFDLAERNAKLIEAEALITSIAERLGVDLEDLN